MSTLYVVEGSTYDDSFVDSIWTDADDAVACAKALARCVVLDEWEALARNPMYKFEVQEVPTNTGRRRFRHGKVVTEPEAPHADERGHFLDWPVLVKEAK